MPRKGPAPRRELMPDPIYRSVLVTQIVNKVLLRGKRSTAERIVYDALDDHRGEDRRRADRHAQAGHRQRQAPARGQEPPRRWRHLPGAGRGPSPPGQHPRHPLDRRLLPPAPGEDDGRAPGQRAARRLQRRRRLGQAPRGHAQDGRVQQGLRPLPLVAGPTSHREHASGPAPATGPARPVVSHAQPHCERTSDADMAKREFPLERDPQHRDHGPHRRGQDHDDRADPLLHRQDLQDR